MFKITTVLIFITITTIKIITSKCYLFIYFYWIILFRSGIHFVICTLFIYFTYLQHLDLAVALSLFLNRTLVTPLALHSDSLFYTFECFRHWSPFYVTNPVRIPLGDTRFASIRPFSFLSDALWQPRDVQHLTITTQNWFDVLRIIQKLRYDLVVVHFERPIQPVVDILTGFSQLNAELELVRSAWQPLYKPYNSWCIGMDQEAYLAAHLAACRYHPQLSNLSDMPDVTDYGRGVCWNRAPKRYSGAKLNQKLNYSLLFVFCLFLCLWSIP